jgi:hypothetical protein
MDSKGSVLRIVRRRKGSLVVVFACGSNFLCLIDCETLSAALPVLREIRISGGLLRVIYVMGDGV